ncbi:MAG: hypothetical protein HY681_13345 [Chloroflexi bacterium]|nr:hypothetical protein [Chloroflexota bacterium]
MRKLQFVVLTLALAALATGVAFAHERRDVIGGKYQFVVGFIVEPPYEGQKNGVDLRIMRKADNSAVTGAETTLKVEITHVPSAVSKTMDLRAIFGDNGHYTADLIPTATGHYRMRFFGTVEGNAVEETFNSRTGGGNFNDVQSSVDLQFPAKLPEARELDAAARGALNAAQGVGGTAAEAKSAAESAKAEALDARSKASTAINLAATGIALALAGAVIGVAGLTTARKKMGG